MVTTWIELKSIWPEVVTGEPVQWATEEVWRVRLTDGTEAYLRPDHGSSQFINKAREAGLPAPSIVANRNMWMLLHALPGYPLCEAVWTERPEDLVHVAAEALLMIHQAGMVHGDPCLPNILAEPESNRVTGIVDWGQAKMGSIERDLAATVWSCRYNGLTDDQACLLLTVYGWKEPHLQEVARLRHLYETAVP